MKKRSVRAMSSWRPSRSCPGSTANSVISSYLSTGYPLGAQSLLGVISGMLGVSAAVAWQSFISAMAAVLRGEIEIGGDWELLVRFQRLFPIAPDRATTPAGAATPAGAETTSAV